MAKLVFPDEAALLAALQGNEAERRQALQHFFQNPRLLAWVLRHVQIQGGSEQDGKDSKTTSKSRRFIVRLFQQAVYPRCRQQYGNKDHMKT